VERYRIIGIPINSVKKDRFDGVINQILNDKSVHQIVLVTLWEIIRARFSREFRRCLERAVLIIPKTKGVARCVSFIWKKRITPYTSFDFIIKMLGVVEKRTGSIYLLGSDSRFLSRAESNIKETFPGARVVGRYTGGFSKGMTKNILMAIRKSAPDLFLGGEGMPGKDLWVFRNRSSFNPGIFIWSREGFDILSCRRKRVSKKLSNSGLDYLPSLITHPWRVLRIFPYMLFIILLLFQKITRPSKR
jgi:N-acetylglucosaminyldiphosphoundecaprenol N-acetyl-beta-D-mannosaminyltransferase